MRFPALGASVSMPGRVERFEPRLEQAKRCVTARGAAGADRVAPLPPSMR
jgi:hypothetical protein